MKDDHIDYILKKEKKSLELFDEQMIKGKIFEKLDKLQGSFSDFEKPVAIEPDTEFSEDAKTAPDKSTKKSKVPADSINEELSDE